METNNSNVAMQAAQTTENQQAFIKILLLLLIVITVFQFGSFGMQSVKYILGLIYDVAVVSTPLDALIGFLAMVASAYVFGGSILQWMNRVSATKYLIIGASLFVIKNIFDLVNVTILFNMANSINTAEQITELAAMLGGQFFQLAFWVFVIGYFKLLARR